MLNERDVKIVRHIERYGFITISQCYKMFFDNRAYGYDLARKRLAKLKDKGHLYSSIDYLERNPEKIYYIEDTYSSPNKHTILIMNTLAEIIKLGGVPMYFTREKKWLDGERRSDGYMLFRIQEYFYQLFIEVEGHTTKKKASRESITDDFNDKYTDILGSQEPINFIYSTLKVPQDKYNSINPITRILVIDNTPHSDPWFVDDEKVIQVDFSFNQLGKILI